MKIIVRPISKEYREVKAEFWDTVVEVGVLDKQECLELAQSLASTIDELRENWPEES